MLACIESDAGMDPASLNPAVAQKLFDIAARMPTANEVGLLTSPGSAVIKFWQIDESLTVSKSDVDQWTSFFDLDSFAGLVVRFSLQYMLTVMVDTSEDGVALLKFRHVEVSRFSSQRNVFQKLGIDSSYFLIEAPAAGRAAREHFRLIAPSGTFFESVTMVALSEYFDKGAGKPIPAVSSSSYQARLTPERTVVYTRNIAEDDYAVAVSMRPMLSAFVRPALYSVLASFLLLLGGFLTELKYSSLTNGSSSTGAAVAILLLFPSGVSAYLAREGEHEILKELLAYCRLVVALSGAVTILSAGFVVVHASHRAIEWCWAASAAYCFLVLLTLTVVFVASRQSYKSVAHDSRELISEDIPRI